MKKKRKEEAIIKALGDPKAIAKQIKADYHIKKAETKASAANIARAVYASIGLGLFNLILILGPFIAILGILVGLFAAAISITITGIATFVASIFSNLLPQHVSIGVSAVGFSFASVGIICFGLLFLIGDFYLTKLIFKLTIRYLKFNLGIIKGKEVLK